MKRALIPIAVAGSLMLSAAAQQSPSQQPTNQQSTKSTDSTPPADSTKEKSAAEKFPFPESESPSSPPRSTDSKSTDTKPKSAAEEFPFPESESPNVPPRSSEPRSPNDSSSKDRDVDISPPGDDKSHEGSDLVGPDAAAGVTEMKPWNPHQADKDVEIGMYYFKLKNYSAAESRFREALHWQDNHAQAIYRLATVLEKEGKAPEAKQYYLQYLRILPDGEFAKDTRKALDRVSGEGSKKTENKPPTSQP
jgi:tetratricopeptide (TPR) repeat protein